MLDSEIMEYETSTIDNSDISDDSDEDDLDNANDELQPGPSRIPIIIQSSRSLQQLPKTISINNSRSLGVTSETTKYRGRSITKSMQTSTPIENGRTKNGNLTNAQRHNDSQIELSEDDD